MRLVRCAFVFGLVFCLAVVGCEGPVGPTGPTGPAGEDGLDGKDGEDGEDGKDGTGATTLSYVLNTSCKSCHGTIHDAWRHSGHAHAMLKVQGSKPTDPPYSAYPAQPPTDDAGKSYAWSDVTYVVGGFGWRALFADAKGYLITGSQVQYVTATQQWTEHDKSTPPGTAILDCPACHTTGFQKVDGHEISKKQDNLEGVGGSWIEEGVTCERCHGPGSLHIGKQGYGPIEIIRSSAACGKCHGSDPAGTIAAQDGLIASAQQYNELSATMMRIVACVDCHDPHRSARYDDAQLNPDRGIVTRCETCHYKKVGANKVAKHATVAGGPGCVDCHMPPAAVSAQGNAALWTGDLRSHLFRINTDSTAPQLSADGKSVMPYLTLGFTCRQCHPDTTATPDAVLQTNASGYHD